MLFIIVSWCFVGYTLANEGSTPLILVNRMILNTNLKVLEQHITEKHAVYYYTNNEMTEVSCINIDKSCNVQLHYDYAEKLHENFKRSKFSSPFGIGFRLKLKEIHNKSQMVCRSSCYERQSIVKVTFESMTESKDTALLNLEINGFTARGIISNFQKQTQIDNITYKYLRSENIHIIANTVHNDTNMACVFDDNKNVIYLDIDYTASKIDLIINIKKDVTLICSLRKANNKGEIIEFKIDFMRLPIQADRRELILSLPKNNIILEMFEYKGKKVIYYEYERNDYFTINCSSKYKDIVYVNFNGQESHNRGIVFRDGVQLTSYSEYILECFTYIDKIERKIQVVLHTRGKANITLIVIIVGGAVTVILIIICIVYKCRSKNVETNVVVFENAERKHDDILSIPTLSNQLKIQKTISVLEIVPVKILKDSVASTNNQPMTPMSPIYANFQNGPRGSSASDYCDYVEPCYSTYNPKRKVSHK